MTTQQIVTTETLALSAEVRIPGIVGILDNINILADHIQNDPITNGLQANAIGIYKKEITSLETQVDDLRDSMVRPLNEQVKGINTEFKKLLTPIANIKALAVRRIADFDAEQERLRRDRERKINEIVSAIHRATTEAELTALDLGEFGNEAGIQLAITQKKQAIAERIRLEAEAAALSKKQEDDAREAARLQAIKDDENKKLREALAQKNAEAAQALAAQQAAEQAQRDAEAAAKQKQDEADALIKKQAEDLKKFEDDAELDRLRQKALAETQAREASNVAVKGVGKRWAFQVTDAALVPRELCSPDEKLIRAAIANGTYNIPGVRVFQETTVR